MRLATVGESVKYYKNSVILRSLNNYFKIYFDMSSTLSPMSQI